MLEFIVLGQIPGTNLQLTFSQITLVFVAWAICLLGALEMQARKQDPTPSEQAGQKTAH